LAFSGDLAAKATLLPLNLDLYARAVKKIPQGSCYQVKKITITDIQIRQAEDSLGQSMIFLSRLSGRSERFFSAICTLCHVPTIRRPEGKNAAIAANLGHYQPLHGKV